MKNNENEMKRFMKNLVNFSSTCSQQNLRKNLKIFYSNQNSLLQWESYISHCRHSWEMSVNRRQFQLIRRIGWIPEMNRRINRISSWLKVLKRIINIINHRLISEPGK